jgi:hypothetical protein
MTSEIPASRQALVEFPAKILQALASPAAPRAVVLVLEPAAREILALGLVSWQMILRRTCCGPLFELQHEGRTSASL